MAASVDPATITTLLAVGGPMLSVAALGWWLSGRFRKVEIAQRDKLDELSQLHREQLDAHEEKDQERHEDNLERFRTISVSLAQLGSSNGTGTGRH